MDKNKGSTILNYNLNLFSGVLTLVRNTPCSNGKQLNKLPSNSKNIEQKQLERVNLPIIWNVFFELFTQDHNNGLVLYIVTNITAH